MRVLFWLLPLPGRVKGLLCMGLCGKEGHPGSLPSPPAPSAGQRISSCAEGEAWGHLLPRPSATCGQVIRAQVISSVSLLGVVAQPLEFQHSGSREKLTV